MSDTTARRKQRRALSDQHVDGLTRYHLRSEVGTARPSDEAGARLLARVAATPRPVRPVLPPPPRRPLWWQSFMSATPRMSARLSSLSAAALLMLLMVHSSLSALNLGTLPTLSSSIGRSPNDALTIVNRGEDTVVDTSQTDGEIEIIGTRPRPVYQPFPQDVPVRPVYPAPESVDVIITASDGPEDPTTLVPPKRLTDRTTSPIISDSPGEPQYRYIGSTIR